MTDPPLDPPTAGTRDEQRLLALLDEYLQAVQARDQPACERLSSAHPELTPLLACLHDLDDLASSAAGTGPHAAPVGPGPIDPPAGSPPFVDPLATVVMPRSTHLWADPSPTAGAEAGPGSADRSGSGAGSGVVHEQFGKYELLEVLGRGGMGIVYKARQKDLNRVVALKLILSRQLATEFEIRRFYAEAKAAGSLRHAHIVAIHEVAELHGQHYFAMDYVEGQSLAELLKQGPLEADQAAACLADVARAVEYLHAHHIVHRDLKPANILLDQDRTPYVSDFGLAKVFEADDGLTQSGSIIGTPSYMAPEQASGRTAEISHRSDVYSLGAILYEMLTGRPPFKEESPLDTLVQVLEGEPTLPLKLNPRVSQELELICLRCLEKNPANRYASAGALADDLERYLKRESIEARPTRFRQRLRRWARREPALVSRLGCLTVASGIVQWNYLQSGGDWLLHVQVMGVFAVWAVVSLLFQSLLRRELLMDWARYSWAAADAVLLTVMLALVEGSRGPLLIGYPLLVAASGMWFRVRLVACMTCISIASYAVLIGLDSGRPAQHPPHYCWIFGAVLALLGFIVAYQVYRVRVLSRYYKHRHGAHAG